MSGILIESVWAPIDLELLLGSSYLETHVLSFAAISLTGRLLNALRSNGSRRRFAESDRCKF